MKQPSLNGGLGTRDAAPPEPAPIPFLNLTPLGVAYLHATRLHKPVTSHHHGAHSAAWAQARAAALIAPFCPSSRRGRPE